jgi:hypothetical protein
MEVLVTDHLSNDDEGLCRVRVCFSTAVVHRDGALSVLCGENARVSAVDPMPHQIQDYDDLLHRLNNMPIGCARQGCKAVVTDGEQYAPACSQFCAHNRQGSWAA